MGGEMEDKEKRKKFRKNLEELGRDESDDSDVEFQINNGDGVGKKVVKEKEISELVVKKVRERLGKKRKIDGEMEDKEKRKKFRKNLEELGRDESDDSDVEFQINNGDGVGK